MLIFNKRKQTTAFKKRNLVTFTNPNSIISDQFRTIRTNLHFLTEETKNKILLITSTGKGEGNSTISANLAVSMAQQKEKVLLIDANLREASIHTIFKLQNNVGLTDLLTKRLELKDVVTSTDFENLDVLTSGTINFNPVELLANSAVKELFKKLITSYDIVLIDSPSILDYTETRVLANQCDGVVLVLNRGKTELEKTIEASRVIELSHGRLIGAIINEK
ncbi:CpsD/CapB family tyrosine-protein kinase [Bacillus sp. AFS053548]|uniref:CpsD/CapB family tyrosine-protein kinase n=1 Tax=Bacillus sp. AFS053548 TaxID=2033505 RepID=UPI00256FB0EE|nr:CpsD/CapB family tyrosine-protein kinase [Bacillus sp. AFS053548]